MVLDPRPRMIKDHDHLSYQWLLINN